MSHAEIIRKWPSLSEFAGDLGLQYGTAKAMKRRNSIPPAYWAQVVAAAANREIAGISLELLASMVSRPIERPEAQRPAA